MLKIKKLEGKKAPLFCLQNQNDEKVCLNDFLKEGFVLLYFYPKDLTTGCTIEAIGFSELSKKFINNNIKIFGISKDLPKTHTKFIKKEGLKVDLLSDIDGKISSRYGVYVEKSMYGKKYMGISRESFLVNTSGKIIKHWENVSPKDHPEEVLSFFKELKEKK